MNVTAKNGEMTRTWKVAVGKSELPKDGAAEEDDDDGFLGLLILAIPVVLIGGGIWMFLKRRKK